MSHLFVDGEFTAHSGGILPFKIDCDALTDEDINTIAKVIAQRTPKFNTVYGVPRGGLRLERALRQYATLRIPDPVLIVDDVLTTGASMEEARARFACDTAGVVIFARGPVPQWITPLFIEGAVRGR